MTAEFVAGWSALLAAGATVFGAVALVLFFTRGQPWGTINDAASVVLMIAMIPVALLVATLESEHRTTWAIAAAVLGIGGMVAAAGLQALLVIGRVTYDQTKGWVLLAGGIVGVWYLLVAFLAQGSALEGGLATLAVVAGVGFLAIGYGFAVGNERHPLSALGGVVLLVGSTAFLATLGVRLVTGDLAVPIWNA